MYIKETEAKDKICPADGIPMCVGSKCMAWQWKKEYHYPDSKNTRGVIFPAKFTGYSKEFGYCGMLKNGD